MKTIKQWFETFEDAEIRKRALRNADAKYQYDAEETIKQAILGGFNWNDTDEGIEFWAYIKNHDNPASVKFDEVKHLIKND